MVDLVRSELGAFKQTVSVSRWFQIDVIQTSNERKVELGDAPVELVHCSRFTTRFGGFLAGVGSPVPHVPVTA